MPDGNAAVSTVAGELGNSTEAIGARRGSVNWGGAHYAPLIKCLRAGDTQGSAIDFSDSSNWELKKRKAEDLGEECRDRNGRAKKWEASRKASTRNQRRGSF